MANPKLLVMAGGTGGHVFPGLAVADYLKAQGWDIHWLGTAERMEAQLVPKHGYDISFIDIKGVRGNGLARKLAAPFKLFKAIAQARKIIRQQQPDVVLGMGGFASGPGGVAARLLGKPLVLHEQNAAAGLTNRWLAKIAQRVLLAFPGALTSTANTLVVGNPVRDEVLALQQQDKPAAEAAKATYRLLVVGGSLGAQILNQELPKALAALPFDLEVIHQVGGNKLEATRDEYQKCGIELETNKQVQVLEFIDDMAAAYQWADVVLCRAGALTVSEVAAAGLPAIFVPLPHAVDDHQTKNAAYLVDAGAALLLPQRQMNTERLVEALGEFVDPGKRNKAAELARQHARLDATAQVAEVCQQLVKSSK